MLLLPAAMLAGLLGVAGPAPATELPFLPHGEPERIQANENRTPAGSLRDGVLTLHLEVRTGIWYPEAEDGRSLPVQAFGERGRPLQIPGPLIRVPRGTTVHATLRNTLSDSTLVVYGLHTRPGRPDDTLHVAPGARRTVRFEAGEPGTYYYWGTTRRADMESRAGADSQLTGAFIVDPPGVVANDRVFVMGLWARGAHPGVTSVPEDQEVMVINGKSWPHTERLTFTVGDSVRWRWINASASSHPMHLHGFYFRVDSRGGWAADTLYRPGDRRLAVTELMLPGATNAFRWVPEREGNWIFHCHFGFHVSHHLLLRDAGDTVQATAAGNGGHEAHAKEHRMAGLVLGLHVLPRPGSRASVAAGPPRKIRLLVQESPRRYGEEPGLAFLAQEGPTEPAPDSITLPSSTLVLRRGEPVAITVVNRLKEPTAVHWHGIELESFPDGVPNWSGTPGRTMPPVAPGDSFVAEFVPPRAGTFIYHSHSNELRQISSGLYGTLLVVEPGQEPDPGVDHVVLVGAAGPALDAPGLVNGRRRPPPLDLQAGRTYRIRVININPDWRVTFSLRSDTEIAKWRPVAKDGADLPASQAVLQPAFLLTGPGETADFEFTPEAPGTMRLDVTTQLSGWHVPVPIRVRERGR